VGALLAIVSLPVALVGIAAVNVLPILAVGRTRALATAPGGRPG